MQDKISTYIEKGELGKVFELIVSEFKKDTKNIRLIENLSQTFIESGLEKELIDLYKTEFYYTLEPKIFDKIGDIYFGLKDYESALDSYLNYAEVTEDRIEVYNKLAKTFELLGDEQSKQACLEQAKLLKAGENG